MSELVLGSPARRKLSAPAVARSKSNRCFGETYVLITRRVVYLNHYTVMVSICQSLFAVYLGIGTYSTSVQTAVRELTILGLWYTMYPGSFGGGTFLVSIS